MGELMARYNWVRDLARECFPGCEVEMQEFSYGEELGVLVKRGEQKRAWLIHWYVRTPTGRIKKRKGWPVTAGCGRQELISLFALWGAQCTPEEAIKKYA